MQETIRILMTDDHPIIIEGYQNTLLATKKDSQDLIIDIANNTETVDLSNHLHIYPNPATSFINIPNHISLGSATIIDLLGRKIAHIELAGEENVTYNVASLPRGTYLVRFRDEQNQSIHTTRFVKK